MARRHRALAALLAAGLLAGASAGPASAAPEITLHLSVDYTCFSFEGTPNTTHAISLWDGTTLVDLLFVTTGANGVAWPCFSQDVASGMKVKAQKSGYSRWVTVPNLSVKADRITDVISGVGPASKTIGITVHRLKVGTYEPGTEPNRTPTVGADGAYSTDLTTAGGIRGGDRIDVSYANASGDSFKIQLYVEHMVVERGATRVRATLDPGLAQVVLRNASDVVRARAKLVPTEYFGHAVGRFTTATGLLRAPRTGDKVVGDFASDAVMTVPAITATAVASTDTAKVTCPGMAAQGAKLEIRKADGSDYALVTAVTNASGVATFDLASQIDLAVGDSLHATCRYDSGDEIAVHARVGW